MSKKTEYCSFCGASNRERKKIIKGSSALICDECIVHCHDLLQEKPKPHKVELLTPKEIKSRLDEYVVGQDDAKKILSLAVYNHYKRLRNDVNDDGIEIDKSNILMIGSTGVGKTFLAKTLAKILNVPFAIADATSLTEAGYVGDDVESVLNRLLLECDNSVERAEQGIIYIDEIDKIAKKTSGTSLNRDVSGEGVQQALLKLIEGTIANVNAGGGRKHPNAETLKINTQNILFICGGAFVGLPEIVLKRQNKGGMGFSATIKSNVNEEDKVKVLRDVQPEDLVEFGFIPEFIGRLPIITSLDNLDEDALRKILSEPKNSILKQMTKLFKMDNCELEVTDDAVESIVKKAKERKTGARGLRSIIENSFLKIMFELPSIENVVKVVITKQVIDDNADPIIVLGEVKDEVDEADNQTEVGN